MRKLIFILFNYSFYLYLLLFFQCDSSLEEELEKNKILNREDLTTSLAESISFAVGAGSTSVSNILNAGAVYFYGEDDSLLKILTVDKPEKDANFGSTFAISDDRIAVSAFNEDFFEDDDVERKFGYFDAGAVYLYDKNYKLVKKLRSSDIGAKDYFGVSVAFLGDKLLVGCVYESAQNVTDAGAVSIFDKNGKFIKKLTSDAPQQFSDFGRNIKVDGDRIVISAYKEDVSSVTDSGAVYLFDENGKLIKKLVADTLQASAEFGSEIIILDDVVIVSAYYEDVKGVSDSGAVYLFNKENGNLIKKLILDNPQKDAEFGNAIAVSGDKIVIGAYMENVNGIANAGAVYLYSKLGNLIKKITLEKPKDKDIFGTRIVASDENILIGAARRDVAGFQEAGSAYLFNNDGKLIKEITSKNPQQSNFFGLSMAIKKDKIILGAPNEDVDGIDGAGIIYLLDNKGDFIKQFFSQPTELKGYFGSEIKTN